MRLAALYTQFGFWHWANRICYSNLSVIHRLPGALNMLFIFIFDLAAFPPHRIWFGSCSGRNFLGIVARFFLCFGFFYILANFSGVREEVGVHVVVDSKDTCSSRGMLSPETRIQCPESRYYASVRARFGICLKCGFPWHLISISTLHS